MNAFCVSCTCAGTYLDDVLYVNEATMVEAGRRQGRNVDDIVIEGAVAAADLTARNAEDITRVRATLSLSEIAYDLKSTP